MKEYLQATQTIESTHSDVIAFVQQHLVDVAKDGVITDTEKAIILYEAVRDEVRYDPYSIDLSIEGFKASETLKDKEGWCVPKAILLAACCRAANIPARLGFADVCNHMTTARLRAVMQTDVFYWHGYTAIFLNGVWVKATPAFNKELCEKLNLAVLKFDGENDSLYQEYDAKGNRHMEYLYDHGHYADLPLKKIVIEMKKHYGEGLVEALTGGAGKPSFETEIQSEL